MPSRSGLADALSLALGGTGSPTRMPWRSAEGVALGVAVAPVAESGAAGVVVRALGGT